MFPRNPFNSTYAEMANSNESFLALFDHTVLDTKLVNDKPFLCEDMFEQCVFFSSSPGGGKSSMFHFFSPPILNSLIQSSEQNIEGYHFLESLGVVKNKTALLLGVTISCARNYGVIEDIYEEGVAQQVFYALLNVRTLKEALKCILLLNKADESDLSKISFDAVPEEMSAVFRKNWTGKDYYDWACQEELRICDSINNMELVSQVSFLHNYYSIIQLFEASKIRFDGKLFVKKTLFMLDDVHKLTKIQRNALRESLFTVRAHVGVWLAQRSYALTEDEVLGQDGMENRDYFMRKLEDFRYGRTKQFYKALETISDRRVKASDLLDNTGSFRACISENIDWSSDAANYKKLFSAYSKLKEKFSEYELDFQDDTHLDPNTLFERAITLRTIKIFVDRKINNLQLTLWPEFLEPTEADVSNANNNSALRSIAEYYLCIENNLPFYYGMDKILSLSFYNVYQYLNIAGELFARRLTYLYEKKKRSVFAIPPAEQDAIITRVSEQRWKELDVIYSNSSVIKHFLESIAKMGIETRETGTASYSGGAYTGIGIRDAIYMKILKDPKCQTIKSLLATCVSGNLLNIQEVKQGNKDEQVHVFYLNRWLCVHFRLPLAYGGWRPCNEELLKIMCDTDPVQEPT